jgi:transcriptional regulator with XRE-family HTH domain
MQRISQNQKFLSVALGTCMSPTLRWGARMRLQDLFGANVRHHRKAKGWTIDRLAERVGVTQETIGKIERGKAAPLFETAETIAAALNVDVTTLFGAGALPGKGERVRLVTEIHRTLSRMNEDQLDRAAKMLKAFVG